jgi:hypothetical protein
MPKSKDVAPSKPTESRIKTVLSAADEARRREDARLAKDRRAVRERIQSQTEKLLTPYWKKTGLDVAAFKKNQAQAQIEMRRAAENQKADAIKQSSALKDRLRHGVQSWGKTIERFRLPNPALVSEFVPGYVEILTPFIIWPTNGLELIDSHIEPRNNWAKITGQSTASSGAENLRFIFVWDNPNDRFTAVNVASFLALNGSCEASADGGTAGIFPGGTSNLQLTAFLNVWQWWEQPPIQAFPEITQRREVLNLSADGGGWFGSVGDIEVRGVSGNFDVSYSLFVLPPNGVAVFEVTLLVSYQNDDGRIALDFSSGGFEIMCPEVAIAILT